MDDLTPEQRRQRMCPCTPEPVLPGFRSAEEARAAAEHVLASGDTTNRVIVSGDPCTPSTEHVRAVYAAQHGDILTAEHGREFDRWLAGFVPSTTVPQLARLVRENERLRAIVENAPHDWRVCPVGDPEWTEIDGDPTVCRCWKADALTPERSHPSTSG